MKILLLISFLFILVPKSDRLFAQKNHPKVINNLKELNGLKEGIHNYWLKAGSNTFGNPILIPIIIFQGKKKGKTLGLTAAIHGNELNGIAIIHKLKEVINIRKLTGRIIAIPGLNVISVQLDQRRFYDYADLNRSFPGKEHGNRNQQYAYTIAKK